METSNYNMALELLGDYKHELKRQIDKTLEQRKGFIDSLTHEANLEDVKEFDSELVRLEDALYRLDTFLLNFA